MKVTAKEVVLSAIEAINVGDIDKALSFYSDSVRQLSPATDSCGFRERVGKDALRRVLEIDASKHRARFIPHAVVSEGNLVAVQSVNVGQFEGRQIEQPVAAFYVVANEKITQVTVYYDRAGLRAEFEKS